MCVINTCSVTDTADKKCRNLIRRLSRQYPEAIIVVTGCYAQLRSAEIAEMEGVDLVVGNNEKGDLVQLVKSIARKGGKAVYTCESAEILSFFSSFSAGDRTRAFLKVQDGCSYNCSYCTIPLARGESRSTSVEQLVEQAQEIAARAVKEIVLTGVNIGDFGRGESRNFFSLIEQLDKIEGIERYRISSIEPNLLTDEIIAFTATSTKFQPHFHIPLQSGSDKILGLMRRRYNTALFEKKILALREKNPDVFIGIDVIVGFPGETETEFMETYNLLSRLRPAYLHVFPYSERANTDAITMDGKVSQQEKHLRVERLTALCHDLHTQFCCRFEGTTSTVLIEGFRKGGVMYGYTPNYIKVELPYRKELINTIVEVTLAHTNDNETMKGIIKQEA